MQNSSFHYVTKLYRILQKYADKENAHFMKRYMKDLFPFFGIKSPKRKEIFRQFIKSEGIPLISELSEVVKLLYQKSERELHYFAMELVDKYSKKLDEKGIELFEYMIVNKSWWDTVDYIAVHSLSEYFRRHPGLIKPFTAQWMESGNIWLQRTCILFQLKYRKDTDLKLLYSFILRLKHSNEFFIQKAIGWILREYSKINPDEVIRFVNNIQLKPLSKREASRITIEKGYISTQK